LKILYITTGCFDKGGISRYSRYQIVALREIFGVENVFAMSLRGVEHDSIEENFKVEYAGKGNGKLEQIKFAINFIWNIFLLKPKIILSAHVNFSGMAVFFSKLIGAKTVLNVYGLELWSGLSKDAAYGLKRVNKIISDCYNTKNYLIENGLRKEQDITVIWDCVDLEKFKPYEGNSELIKSKYAILNRGRKIILTLGRISHEAKHKGYYRLIEMFSMLDKEKYYLVLAGKGNMVANLKQLVCEKEIEESVCFTGMINEADMGAIYSIADVFSLVSEVGVGMGEGIPLTPLEAMACGTPIVVGNQDGSREAVFENKNGIIIDPFDLDAHKNAIEKLTNVNEVIEYSSQARQLAVDVFSYNRFKEQHQSFFNLFDDIC
jgi:phosphatidylinositol alpha-1,6-mannosyltransferase